MNIENILTEAYFIIFALVIGVLLPIAYSFNKNLFEQIYLLKKDAKNNRKKLGTLPINTVLSYCYYTDQVIYVIGIFSFVALITPFLYYLLPLALYLKIRIIKFLWLEFIAIIFGLTYFSWAHEERELWRGRKTSLIIIFTLSFVCFILVYIMIESFTIRIYVLITGSTLFSYYLLWHLGGFFYTPLSHIRKIHRSLLQ